MLENITKHLSCPGEAIAFCKLLSLKIFLYRLTVSTVNPTAA